MAPTEEYSRADVRRKFGLSERVLKSWESQDFIPSSDTYSFSDLIAIQTLIKLRENRIQPRQIGRAIASLRQKLDWIKQPLSELRIVSDGRKIAVHIAGQKMEAISGQILFDFEAAELGGIKNFPERKTSASRLRESEIWFQKGLDLEETGAPVDDAIQAYQKVLELNPSAAGALVNLGTIFYRQRKFGEAVATRFDDPQAGLVPIHGQSLRIFDDVARMRLPHALGDNAKIRHDILHGRVQDCDVRLWCGLTKRKSPLHGGACFVESGLRRAGMADGHERLIIKPYHKPAQIRDRSNAINRNARGQSQ